VPVLVNDYRGTATIETFTVIYDRDGAPLHGVVIAKTPEGERGMARVAASNTSVLAVLTDPSKSPIGLGGNLSSSEGLLRWEM